MQVFGKNLTRWSSAFLMLESVKKAFDDEIVAGQVDLKSIEIYLQILNPAYRISLSFQKNSSTIADFLPYLLQLIEI